MNMMGWAGLNQDRPYLEQFERAKRWHTVLNCFRNARISEDAVDQDRHIDDIYAFFINCFHLKDWIVYSRPDLKNIVQQFVNENEALQICRDICNSTKHFSLIHPSTSETPFGHSKLLREFQAIMLPGEDYPVRNQQYIILCDDKKHNVFMLADKCIELWTNFLRTNKLLQHSQSLEIY